LATLCRRWTKLTNHLLHCTCVQASLVYIPSFYAELGPIERPVLERMVTKLEELDMVMAVHHNAE
jgi:transcriptional/translational regulatory protein YebC/TACO1